MSNSKVILHMENGEIQAITANDPNVEVFILDASEQVEGGRFLSDYEAMAKKQKVDVVDEKLVLAIDNALKAIGIQA